MNQIGYLNKLLMKILSVLGENPQASTPGVSQLSNSVFIIFKMVLQFI